MKILRVEATNFGSYKELEFDFTNSGLSLIQGFTGSGKSTLCDLVPWTLFGKTAKGGAVDEIRSWNSTEDTTSTITLMLKGKMFQVGRKRGKVNDLIIYEDGGAYRGKDLLDTQKIINAKLGLDYELYLASAYYHEFSQTAQFFTTTAKNRRTICEQLVDLSLAVKLQANTKAKQKELDTEKWTVASEYTQLQSNVTLLERLQITEKTKAKDWETSRQRRLESMIKSYEHFEANRKKVISKKCNSCGTVLQAPKEVIDDSENPYTNQLISIEAEKNPHSGSVKDYKSEITTKTGELTLLEQKLEVLATELSVIEQLSEVVDLFRSASITNTISFLETKTNELLTKLFDAEIKVSFEVSSADKVDVTIYKDGNQASFTQLSKGQRQLLKLCFGVSVMQTIQNHHGIQLAQLWFDEATDGLDEGMKLKALKMLETLTLLYDQIYLVEHSESLKAMVDQKFTVTLVNGESQIEKT